jgi:uroporphyrinogen-III synthase
MDGPMFVRIFYNEDREVKIIIKKLMRKEESNLGEALAGKRIAIGASRKTEEISAIIEKQGGKAVVRSLQGTIFIAEKEVEPDLMEFIQEGADWVIFTTGTGTETLLKIAKDLGVKERFLEIIHQAKVASRGYKTRSTLKKLGVIPVAMDEDGTTRSLIKSLGGFDLTGKRVMVQLHGETAPALVKFLQENGADVTMILPYQHIPPEEKTVKALCIELLRHELDAVCFTTAIQVRSLFDYAKKNDIFNSLVNCFKEETLAVAVGKVTGEALKEEGIERFVIPEHERMGAMIIELSRYYSKN